MLSNNTPVLVGIAAQWVAKRSPNLSLFSIHLNSDLPGISL